MNFRPEVAASGMAEASCTGLVPIRLSEISGNNRASAVVSNWATLLMMAGRPRTALGGNRGGRAWGLPRSRRSPTP